MTGPGDPAGLSDQELVARVAHLEAAAFDVLYERHGPTAFSLARRMLGASRAEDVVKDAFINLWHSAPSYDPARGQVRAWILGMVRRRSLDMLGTLSVQERRQLDDERLEDHVASRDAADSAMLPDEDFSKVRRALQALPAEQRVVLELAYFAGCTQREIAERLELPLATVTKRSRMGLDKLKLALLAVLAFGG